MTRQEIEQKYAAELEQVAPRSVVEALAPHEWSRLERAVEKAESRALERSEDPSAWVLPAMTWVFQILDKQHRKFYRDLSVRGKRLYEALRARHPGIPASTPGIDGGAVIYSPLPGHDFEIFGGYYRRPIHVQPWRLSEEGIPMYTEDMIDVPSGDPAAAADAVANIWAQYLGEEILDAALAVLEETGDDGTLFSASGDDDHRGWYDDRD